MKTGLTKHGSGRLFNEKQLAFSIKKNTNPIFAIRIEKRYSTDKIITLKKKTSTFFKTEIAQLLKIGKIVIT